MSIDRRTLIASAAASAVLAAAPASAAAHPDADLIALGETLARLAGELDAIDGDAPEWSTKADEISDTITAMEHTRALTVDGLRVKARANVYTANGADKLHELVRTSTFDTSLAVSVVLDVLAMFGEA